MVLEDNGGIEVCYVCVCVCRYVVNGGIEVCYICVCV